MAASPSILPDDLEVFKLPAERCSPIFFQTPTTFSFYQDAAGERWGRVDYLEGGRVEFPLPGVVWIEPERH